MAVTYVDTDGGGSNTAPYDTWAKATTSLQTGITTASASGTVYFQGAAADTAAISRTLTSAGADLTPTRVIGVKDGTTNEGASIVTSDLAIRGTDTLPHFEITGAGNDLSTVGFAYFFGVKITTPDRVEYFGARDYFVFERCEFKWGGLMRTDGGKVKFLDCQLELSSTSSQILAQSGTSNQLSGDAVAIIGGEFLFTANPSALFHGSHRSPVLVQGVDISGLGNNILVDSSSVSQGSLKFINCNMPATYTKLASNFTIEGTELEMIGCSDGSSRGATESIQDYSKYTSRGSIESEQTVVRTGGADDGASGLFAYSMTPNIDSTLEGTYLTLESPQMAVWLAGGLNTLTLYIANSSISTDFNEDEVWVEFYTPDSGDTAQHDQTFYPADARPLASSTAITDDTGSTWGTGGNNHQKLSITITTGFEGWAYARLHYAKRFASSPTTLYLDPKIIVT